MGKRFKKGRGYVVPKEGSEVFVPRPGDAQYVGVPVGGKILRMKMADHPHVKTITDDEYCGQPRKEKPCE